MSENDKLEKRSTALIRENTQYVVGFIVIAGLLMLTGLPVFIIFFFGILAYFIWKTLSAPSGSGTREIFEFYLIANDILRDDERRWYGFEIQDAIARGENILRHMSGAPPLVNFALGALYHKIGDHHSAVKNLGFVIENDSSDESRFIYPSSELRNYVRTLRKIEREPAEAPLMSSAVRALERARRNRGAVLLEASRVAIDRESIEHIAAELPSVIAESNGSVTQRSFIDAPTQTLNEEFENRERDGADESSDKERPKSGKKTRPAEANAHGRQTISEVLRDIYDSKT